MIVIHAFIREILTPLLLGMLAASIIAGLLGGAIFLFVAAFDRIADRPSNRQG